MDPPPPTLPRSVSQIPDTSNQLPTQHLKSNMSQNELTFSTKTDSNHSLFPSQMMVFFWLFRPKP